MYTDSAFSYFVIHRDLGSWLRNYWKTAAGIAPKHEDLLRSILTAVGGPHKLAVIKIQAHTKDGAIQARGRSRLRGKSSSGP